MALSSGPLKILRGEREQGGDCVSIIVDANGCTLADVFDEDDARAIVMLPKLIESCRCFVESYDITAETGRGAPVLGVDIERMREALALLDGTERKPEEPSP